MSERLDDLCASFQRALRAEGRAPRTVTLYSMSVRMYGDWLRERGRPETLDQLTRSAVREWLEYLRDGGREASTIRTRYKGLHRFCKWLVAEGDLDKHPMQGLEAPTATVKPVPVLSDDHLNALIKACSGRDFMSRRDEAMIRFLLDTGVRVSELCGLSVSDVDLDRETAIVRGKGNKVRAVYLTGARTVRALDRYLRLRRTHRWSHLYALWLTQRGALSTDGARDRVRIRGEQAGIPDLHPHQFRHTFAHDYMVSGGQERDLKRLAGWSSDVMLERYGASAADARAEAAARRMGRGDRV